MREPSTQHPQSGNAYKAVYNRARIFREIDCPDPEASVQRSLKKLAEERDDLNSKSPIIPRRAFERARKGIEAGEAHYQVDTSP